MDPSHEKPRSVWSARDLSPFWLGACLKEPLRVAQATSPCLEFGHFSGGNGRCSPEGTADNSPAVHCRGPDGENPVPKGRLNSVPQIPLGELDLVLLQQHQEFLLERHFAMMLLLIADVANECVQLRHAHVERSVFFLPLEESVFREGVVNPFGGAALDQLGSIRDR